MRTDDVLENDRWGNGCAVFCRELADRDPRASAKHDHVGIEDKARRKLVPITTIADGGLGEEGVGRFVPQPRGQRHR